MKVYKYCKPEHNPLVSTNTILRLGTTIAFRKDYKGEGDFINDLLEGLASGTDKNRNTFERIKLFPDGFIFSTSVEKVDPASLDPEYSSCYCISDVDAFVVRLLDALYDKFDTDLISIKSLKALHEDSQKIGISWDDTLSKLKIIPHGGVVNYEKGANVQVNDFRNVDELILVGHFYKPEIHAYQKEYRFLFLLGAWEFLPGQVIYCDPKEDALFVDIPDIRNFIETCD